MLVKGSSLVLTCKQMLFVSVFGHLKHVGGVEFSFYTLSQTFSLSYLSFQQRLGDNYDWFRFLYERILLRSGWIFGDICNDWFRFLYERILLRLGWILCDICNYYWSVMHRFLFMLVGWYIFWFINNYWWWIMHCILFMWFCWSIFCFINSYQWWIVH